MSKKVEVHILKDCKYAFKGIYIKEFKKGDFVEIDGEALSDFLRLGWAQDVASEVEGKPLPPEIKNIVEEVEEKPKKQSKKSKKSDDDLDI